MSFETVKEVIIDTINCDADDIKMESNLRDDLSIDSLDATELCMALEEHYNTTIEEDAMVGFVKVSDIVEYIDKNVEA